MLLSREEMSFDFKGKKLDPVRDKDTIVWAVQQFLYGEVTGIQIGHWLYNAPDLDAARFLSRQAVEEFQHVGNFLRILTLLDAQPAPANPTVRFLATGMMGGSWAEHVTLEMAMGEGLVLQAFYAIIATVDHPEIVQILERGVKQEERHVAFGERRTMLAVQGKPWLRRRLLGLALVSLWGVGKLEGFMRSRLPMDHPALAQLPDLVKHSVRMAETRLIRMGLIDRPLSEVSTLRKLGYVAEAYLGKALGALVGFVWAVVSLPLRLFGVGGPKRLTDTYLSDPYVISREMGYRTKEEVDAGATASA